MCVNVSFDGKTLPKKKKKKEQSKQNKNKRKSTAMFVLLYDNVGAGAQLPYARVCILYIVVYVCLLVPKKKIVSLFFKVVSFSSI